MKYCTSLDNSPTRNVINMVAMFSGCYELITLDVSGFNTNNVSDMVNMFGDCSALTMLDVSGFNTNNVTNMRAMFEF